MWGLFLSSLDQIYVYSDFTRRMVLKVFGDAIEPDKLEIGKIPIDYIRPVEVSRKRLDAPIHIGIIGNIGVHKGLKILNQMADIICSAGKDSQIKLYIIGKIDLRYDHPHFIHVGTYERDRLPEIIEKHQIDIVFIPSIWGETFCRTVQEGILMGLPTACYNLGAPADRIRDYEKGLIIDRIDAQQSLDKILEFVKVHRHKSLLRMKRVYQFGTFDVANYGDLLFPLLAARRLRPFGIELVPVSPMGGKGPWKDCMLSMAIDEVPSVRPPDAVLIGGGNIVTLLPTKLPAYNCGTVPVFSYPDLWVGAARLASEGAAVIWNSPGVPASFAPLQRPFVRECLKRSDYIAVRDEPSRQFLLDVSPKAQISVVPDPAWDLPKMWPREALTESFERAYSSRRQARPRQSLAVHLNSRYAKMPINDVAAILDAISTQADAHIILLAIGPCHGDDELARLTGQEMTTGPLIMDRPSSLQEITACIAHAQLYIGSSMHGLITAAAYGVPSVCVMPGNMVKFEGLKVQLGRKQKWVTSWQHVPESLAQIDHENECRRLSGLGEQMLQTLDRHWKTVTDVIQNAACDNPQSVDQGRTQPRERFRAYRAEFAAMEAARQIQLHEQLRHDLAR
jgi:polysaccharide pyruvyl transferase WcaK-like protein